VHGYGTTKVVRDVGDDREVRLFVPDLMLWDSIGNMADYE
jgi:hypothetical protein